MIAWSMDVASYGIGIAVASAITNLVWWLAR